MAHGRDDAGTDTHDMVSMRGQWGGTVMAGEER